MAQEYPAPQGLTAHELFQENLPALSAFMSGGEPLTIQARQKAAYCMFALDMLIMREEDRASRGDLSGKAAWHLNMMQAAIVEQGRRGLPLWEIQPLIAWGQRGPAADEEILRDVRNIRFRYSRADGPEEARRLNGILWLNGKLRVDPYAQKFCVSAPDSAMKYADELLRKHRTEAADRDSTD